MGGDQRKEQSREASGVNKTTPPGRIEINVVCYGALEVAEISQGGKEGIELASILAALALKIALCSKTHFLGIYHTFSEPP